MMFEFLLQPNLWKSLSISYLQTRTRLLILGEDSSAFKLN